MNPLLSLERNFSVRCIEEKTMAILQGPALPSGHLKALTLSYDDGVTADRRLIEIMNRHGIRGTFHINAGLMQNGADPKRLPPVEVATIYEGHEVAAHGLTHPYLDRLPDAALIQEVLEDRRALEAVTGKFVRGMSYPYGKYNEQVIGMLRRLGITYAPTTRSHGGFTLPGELLAWHPTCHHKNNLMEHAERFLNLKRIRMPALLYVWGRAYEFDNDDNWDLIETFCQTIGGRNDIWYATNQDIADYLVAYRRLEFSADAQKAFNPSALEVWLKMDNGVIQVPAGGVASLADASSAPGRG